MKWSSHNIVANREHQSSDGQRVHDAAIQICRSGCVRPCDWRRLGIPAAFACLLLINAGYVSGQERSKTTPSASEVSRKQQLLSSLEAIRAANAEHERVEETVEEPVEPSELFLDLSNESSTAVPDSESTQASATTLDISMSSSPMQVLMRAVAWIAIVLCVCCLGILGARRWQRERGLLPTISSRSKVVETLSLGPGRTVSLIEMHGYRALVATDAGGIRSLVLAPSPFEDSLMQEEEIHDAAP
jgi:flagellar biogenesis protein FliO